MRSNSRAWSGWMRSSRCGAEELPIQGLTAVGKLRLVERIRDDLAAQEEPFPLPDWALREAARRRDEMIANPHLGMANGEMRARIASSRNGSSRNA
jgi:hypothetical protein